MSLIFRTRAEHGLEGAEAAILWDHGCTGISEEDGWLVAWFAARTELPLEGEWSEAPDIDYVARYYEDVGAVRIPPLVIAPTHQTLELQHGEKPLWLDPGMAFGSGHHETTSSLVEMLAQLDLTGKAVLDVGAGSGILSVAADLLGAGSVVGIDNDEATVRVARQNATLNRSRARFEWATLGEFRGRDPFAIDPATGHPVNEWPVGEAPPFRAEARYDVLVANLFAALHLQLLPAYCDHLAPGGLLLLSGIMQEQAAGIEEALEEDGRFSQPVRLDRGDWASFRATVGGS